MADADARASALPQSHPPLWRNRDYAAWWAGTTISGLGTDLSAIAFPLLMLYETGSVAKAGVTSAGERIGSLVTVLYGGLLADRVSRKAIMVVVPLVQALAVGAVVPLVLTHHVSVFSIGAVAVVQGMVGGVGMGATYPALKRIVPAEQFPASSASRQGRDMATSLVAPPIGGFLFVLARWTPFLGDAVSYLGSAVGSALIRTPLGPERDGSAGKEPVRRQLAEGFRFVRSNTYMRFLTAWIPIINSLFAGMLLLAVALVRHRGGGPVTVGWVGSISAAAGLGGAVFAPRLARRVPGRRLTVAASWLLVLGLLGVSVAPRPWEIGLGLGVVFVLVAPLNTVLEAYEMKIVPDELYGRVSTLIGFTATSLTWCGPIMAGVLADVFGTAQAVAVGAGVCAVIAVWVQRSKAVYLIDEEPAVEKI